VALIAYVDAEALAQGRTSLDHVTAAAGSIDFDIIRMDIGFHGNFLASGVPPPDPMSNTARKQAGDHTRASL
jgi:hypothetical protein